MTTGNREKKTDRTCLERSGTNLEIIVTHPDEALESRYFLDGRVHNGLCYRVHTRVGKCTEH